jgi:hypothetical protein
MAEPISATKLEEMNRILQEAAALLQRAVDVGAAARGEGPEATKAVDREWERFLGGFLGYLRQKGRERGENLLAGISFARVMAGGK